MPNQALRKFFDIAEKQGLGLTYDDVRLRTQHSDVVPSETDTSTRLTRNIHLSIPIVSSAMDTVTMGPMAIAMAEAGGAGTIYRMDDIEAQAKQVKRVKFRLNGLIRTPITVSHGDTVADVLKMRAAKDYAFETFPVLDSDGKIVGLVSGSDFDFCDNTSLSISMIMTPIDQLITAQPGTTLADAYNKMRKTRKKVLLLLGRKRTIEGMYIFSDLKRIIENKGAYNVDKNGQLIVGAGIGAGTKAIKRAEQLAEANCDYFQIDTAHGDSKNVIDTIKILKKKYPHIDILAGNVSSGEQAATLAKAGVDGVNVGQGGGSICTTRVIAGVGVPQVTAVYECARAVKRFNIPVCADGGINSSGDMAIALAVGAESVMVGRLLAGTEESPGETRLVQGRLVKVYRGMSSIGALRKNDSSRDRYRQNDVAADKLVPEGVEGHVPYRGLVSGALTQYVGGIRSSMGYLGARTLKEFRQKAELIRITNAGLRESHPHDMIITEESPNYSTRTV